MDLYSVMGVSNRDKALKWYEVFFGRSVDEVIGEEYLWKIGENAWSSSMIGRCGPSGWAAP